MGGGEGDKRGDFRDLKGKNRFEGQKYFFGKGGEN